jgi:hypothetical protein
MLSHKTAAPARAAAWVKASPPDPNEGLPGAIVQIFRRLADQEQRTAGLANRLQTLEREKAAASGRNEE